MRKGERILQKAYPDRRSFTDEEVDFAEKVIAAFCEPSPRSSALPTRFTAIGDVLEIGGHRYDCILRPKVSMPCDACSGCDFSRKYRNCSDVQCSIFDRQDKKNVWYIEVE